MTHSRSWDMEIGRPSVEHVTLTTVRHLLNVTHKLCIRCIPIYNWYCASETPCS